MLRYLILLLHLTATATAAELLVQVDVDYRTTGAAPWLQAVEIARIETDYMLVICDEATLPALPAATVLDAFPAGTAAYLSVFVTSPEGRVAAARLGAVIFERGEYLLIRPVGDPPAGFTLHGIQAILPLGARSAPRITGIPHASVQRDAQVAAIVAAVAEADYQGTIQDLEDYVTRNARTATFYDACLDAYDTLLALGLDTTIQEYNAEPWYGEEFTCWNVIAEKQGVENPDQIYIICGHFDSTAGAPWGPEPVAPGADDNASGAGATLTAARIMAQYNFRQTVRFICFGAEEQGLCGSTYYAGLAAAAGEDIRGVINVDMVLYAPPGSETMLVPYDSQSASLATALAEAAAAYVPELNVQLSYDPGAAYSDHYPFWQQGYPALQLKEIALSSNPHYHTTHDQLMNYLPYFPFGTRCAKAAISALAALAEPLSTGAVDGTELAVWQPRSLAIRSIAPNPARTTARVSLSAPANGPLELSLIDLLGRPVAQSPLRVTQTADPVVDLNLTELPAGVYWLRAIAGPHTATRKVVVD